MSPLPHFLLASTAAQEAIHPGYIIGQYIGFGIGLAVVLPGLVKCVRIMGRPTTSRMCVTALLLVLLAFLINSTWAVTLQFLPLQGLARHLNLALVAPLFVTALVVGLIGLVEYDSNKLVQGRKQAAWAMVLAFLGLAGSASSLALGLKNEGTVFGGGGEGAPGAEVVQEKFNFALQPPDATWRTIPPESISSTATVTLRGEGDLYAAVVAEIHPSLMNEGIGALVAAVKANLSKQEVKEQAQEPRKLGDLDFVRIRTRFFSKTADMDIAIEHWVATHNGYAWQVAVWGSYEQKQVVEKQAEAMARGFRVLAPDRKPESTSFGTNVERPTLGYSVRLAEKGWKLWPKDDAEFAQLPFGTDFAAKTVGSAFLVTAYQHRLDGPAPVSEALAKAFLSQLDFTYKRSDAAFATRPLTKPFPGLEITTERDTDHGPCRYLFRVHQAGRHAWLIGGWTLKYPGSNLDQVRAACEAVTLSEPPSGKMGAPAPSGQTRLESESQFMNQIGIWYHHKDNGKEAVRYFTEASRMSPEDETYFDNITQAMESDGRAAEALKLMDAAGERPFAQAQSFAARHAWLRVKAGQIKEGAAEMTGLIGDGFADADTVLEWINEFLENEHSTEARAVAAAFADVHPEPRYRLWLAQTVNREDEEAAAELLKALIAEEPDYLPARYTYGEYANRRGKHELALEQAEFLEDQGQETVRLHLMRGWAHMGRKWYRDARASFDQAAKSAPNDEDVKYALQEVSAHLGQGSNQEIKTPIDAVPLPARIASRLEDLRNAPAAFGEGHNSALLLWSCAYQFSPDKPLRTTTRSIVRIMNEEGAGDYSTIQYRFDPLFERLYVSRMEVLNADGEVLERASPDDMYVLDSGRDSMADTDRTVHIQAPGLKPGNILDYEITVERLSKEKNFPLRRHLFGTSIPTQLEVVSIHGDTSSIRQDLEHGGDVKVTREEDSVTFESAHPAILESEDYAVPAETWAPLLVLAPKGTTWDAVARDHLKDIVPQLKPDPEVQAEARRLTEGLTDVREKTRVLTAFVQKTIRYKAIEFGVRGYVPNPAGQTLRQRYGDCKDQAVLLHELLGAAGVPSHLALVNTDWEVATLAPAVDAFNHMILQVPGLSFPGFIDPTASHVAAADHTPSGLWGFKALVLDPDKPALMKIPGPASDSGRLNSRRTVRLSPGDEVIVEEELTLHGYYASGMRRRFAAEEPKARFQYAQDMLDDLGSYRLRDFEFVNLTDPNQPAILRLIYLLPNAIEMRGDIRKLRLPCAWEANYLRFPFIRDRVTSFRWNVPFSMHSEVTFDASIPLAPEALAAFSSRRESPFGHWRFTASERTLDFQVEIRRGTYEAEQYEPFQAIWNASFDAWTKEVTLAVP